MVVISFIIISSSNFLFSTSFFSSLIQINYLRSSDATRINSLHFSNAMHILSFFSSCILLFCSLISSNCEESIGTTSLLIFYFFNFSFSVFLPMDLSKVLPEFISSLSSSRFIELAKVGQDCVAGCLAWNFTLSFKFNHLASFLKIFQQCSN